MCVLLMGSADARIQKWFVARVLLEATLLCYETNCKSYLRDYVLLLNAF